MSMKRIARAPMSAFLCVAAACGGGGDDDDGSEGAGTYVVAGTVRDFLDDRPVAAATVSTDGLSPSPAVSVNGSDFVLEGVPPYSAFHVLAGSPPGYRSTYNPVVEIANRDIEGLSLHVVSESYLGELQQAFGGAQEAGTGVLVGQLLDDRGAPRAGVPASAFAVPQGMRGPYFLDANRRPAPELQASSTSGYFVLFDVRPGLLAVRAQQDSGLTMAMAETPVAATAATLASVVVVEGTPITVPSNVSFTRDVAPIFVRRGCQACHDGGGIGKDLGELHLNGAAEKMYRELTEEISPTYGVTRVNLAAPATSLLLTMPSREEPPDAHPNVTFTGPDDPDYQLILGWIGQGAPQN
jgi:hypothetical protein